MFYCIWFFDQMGWGLVSSGSRLCGLLEHVLFIFIREVSCCPVHVFLNIFPVWTRMVKRNVMWKETRFKNMFCWNKNHTLPGNSFGVPLGLFSFSLQTNQNIQAKQKPTQSPGKSADWAKRREKALWVYMYITARWDLKDSEEWRQEAVFGRTLVFMALTDLVRSVHLAVCWKVWRLFS